MIPSRPSLPSSISRTLGPVDVLGTGRSATVPAGVTARSAARQVGHVAVLVGLHARGARRDPAAERRVVEAVGEVPERPARRVELRLERRPEHARLHAREARHRIDLQHAVQPPEVDAEHRPRLVRGRVEAAGDVRPAAERDHDRVGLERGGEHRRDLLLGARPHDRVGQPPELAAPLQHEVAQALAAPVDDPVERIVRDGRGPDRLLQRGAQHGRKRRLRAPRARRSGARGSTRRTSSPIFSLMNGASAGLSASVNAIPSSPQPHHFIAAMERDPTATSPRPPPRARAGSAPTSPAAPFRRVPCGRR